MTLCQGGDKVLCLLSTVLNKLKKPCLSVKMQELNSLGGSYSGNTADSKSAYVGSIPTPPVGQRT